jgi:hypothetical protein
VKGVILEKPIIVYLVNKFPVFYGTKMFINLFTGRCPEPDEPSPHPHILFLRYMLSLLSLKRKVCEITV